MDQNLIAVIVGFVEGVTEFLPVSSTGHMIIVGHMLGFDGPAADILTFSYSWGRFCQLFLFIKNVLLDFLQKKAGRLIKG